MNTIFTLCVFTFLNKNKFCLCLSIHITLSQLTAKWRLLSFHFFFDRKIDRKKFGISDSHSSKKQRIGLCAIQFCKANNVFLLLKKAPNRQKKNYRANAIKKFAQW